MGLLSQGQPLSWAETERHQSFVRKWGVEQFIRLYNKLNLLECDVLMWGDEIEYTVLAFNHTDRVVRLLPVAEHLLPILQEAEARGDEVLDSLWRPEYASYCVEGIPGSPYNGKYEELLQVEENMTLRRQKLQTLLQRVVSSSAEAAGWDPCVMTITGFPRLGCFPFTQPAHRPEPATSFTRSLFWPDAATFLGHPRFKTLSTNIRERRGEKVCINVPVFESENLTDADLTADVVNGDEDDASLPNDSTNNPALPGHIYMDAMGFGMGMSCLQVTFQASNLTEARILYDQLAPICPVLLALTASSPVFRGYLADVDCRWDVISASVDDRRRSEQQRKCREDGGGRYIPKSRYASISSYLSECATKHVEYNDIELVYDKQVCSRLLESGVDRLMAEHIAHLFIRDTISLFSEKVVADPPDLDDTDHFENIQSTNWQTMRFKPPPPQSAIGWRVEFRPCELQFTDFENAAVVCFIVLLTRVILSRKYNIMIPISKVDVNMERAQKRDAVLNQKFYFRSDVHTMDCKQAPHVLEMTIDQIINGDATHKGLIPMVCEHVQAQKDVDENTRRLICNYMRFLGERASGKLQTNARYIRDFVINHAQYGRDARVTEQIQYDLLRSVNNLHANVSAGPTLFGSYRTAKGETRCC